MKQGGFCNHYDIAKPTKIGFVHLFCGSFTMLIIKDVNSVPHCEGQHRTCCPLSLIKRESQGSNRIHSWKRLSMPSKCTKIPNTHLWLRISLFPFLRGEKEEKLCALALHRNKCLPSSPVLLPASFQLRYLGNSAFIFSFWALQGFQMMPCTVIVH